MKLSEELNLDAANVLTFAVFFSVSDLDNEEIRQTAEILYRDMLSRGLTVLMDDRRETKTAKLEIANQLAIPIRLFLGAETMASGYVHASFEGKAADQNINVEDTPETVAKLATQN